MNKHAQQKREFGRAETIAERKARLAFDRQHPWTPVSEAVIDGTACELLFYNLTGNFSGGDRRFVLIKEPRWGFLEWVCIDGGSHPWGKVQGFRPTDRVLSKVELARLVRRSR